MVAVPISNSILVILTPGSDVLVISNEPLPKVVVPLTVMVAPKLTSSSAMSTVALLAAPMETLASTRCDGVERHDDIFEAFEIKIIDYGDIDRCG